MTGEEIASRLATVSALRALCLRLPHIPTPAETARLKRFDELVKTPADVTERDVDTLVAGWSRWWRQGRTVELAEMAREVDATLIDSDRRLATFAIACRSLHPGSARDRTGNRPTTAEPQ